MTALALLLSSSLSQASSVQPDELLQPEQLEQGFVIVVDDIARIASPDRPMYLASNFGGWDPASRAFKMTQRSDGRWQMVFDKPERTGTIQFKFTLGSWDFVETDPDGADIENRTLPKIDPTKLADGERPVFEMRVPRFRSPADIASGRQNTQYRDWDATGTIRRLQVTGGAGDAAGMMRDLLIWLPPGYDEPQNAQRHYPVLYLMDGQNLFEKQNGQASEWHADETATALIASGEVEPFIIVGIPNARTARIQEYTPASAKPNLGVRLEFEPAGEAYINWLMNTVMPRVERVARVSTKREATGIGGASLGATIALAAVTAHPDRFGLLLLESTAALGENTPIPGKFAGGEPLRVFIGIGEQEMGNDPSVHERNRMFAQHSQVLAAGLADVLGKEQVRLVSDPSGEHNEAAWARRFPDAVRFLLGPVDQFSSD